MTLKTGLDPKTRKLRGWEMMLKLSGEAKQTILSAPHYYSDVQREQVYKDAVMPLFKQCKLRKDELFPKDKIRLVIDAVIEVASLAPLWQSQFFSFICSQADDDAIAEFLRNNPDWTYVTCPCRNSDHDLVCTIDFLTNRNLSILNTDSGLLSDILEKVLLLTGRISGNDDIDIQSLFPNIPGLENDPLMDIFKRIAGKFDPNQPENPGILRNGIKTMGLLEFLYGEESDQVGESDQSVDSDETIAPESS